MGSVFSIFRSKRGTKELLAKIENEIESIEDFKWSAAKRQKNRIAFLFIVSTLVYIVCALLCYFFYFSKTNDFTLKLLYSLPFLVSPFLVWAFKRTLQWYYRWVIDNKDERLRELKKEKKKILEKVQETETFKEAKEILEKYDPKALAELSFKSSKLSSISSPIMTTNMTPQMSQTNSQLRYRRSTGSTPQMRPMPSLMNRMSTPQPTNMRPYLMAGPSVRAPIQTQRLAIMAPNYPQTVKPILPQQRGIMDKLVDYVVGDGPSNRYALICLHCHSHNGMALKEEFEFIAYKCCYCMRFNPPRKMRPLPPRLGPLTQTNRSSLTPVVDEPESDSDSTKGVVNSEENTMKIEDISNDIEIESNRRQSSREPEEESQTLKSEEISEEITASSVHNEIVEDSHIDNEIKESLNETQKSQNETNVSDNETLENEEIAFIDESPQISDSSPVLL